MGTGTAILQRRNRFIGSGGGRSRLFEALEEEDHFRRRAAFADGFHVHELPALIAKAIDLASEIGGIRNGGTLVLHCQVLPRLWRIGE